MTTPKKMTRLDRRRAAFCCAGSLLVGQSAQQPQAPPRNRAVPATESRIARTAGSRSLAEARSGDGRAALAEGSIVADLGAGGGWFTIRLARRVGRNGMVYAVDVQRLMIEAIERRVQREGLTNVKADARHRRRPAASAGAHWMRC